MSEFNSTNDLSIDARREQILQNINKKLSKIENCLSDFENIETEYQELASSTGADINELIDTFQYYKKINRMHKPWHNFRSGKTGINGYLFFNLNDYGQLHGDFKIFNGNIDNLNLYAEGSYNNGKYSGIYKQYLIGTNICKNEYNCETSEYIEYRQDGSKYKYIENYVSNIYNGIATYYDKNNNIKYSNYYKDGCNITKNEYEEMKDITKSKKINSLNKFFE